MDSIGGYEMRRLKKEIHNGDNCGSSATGAAVPGYAAVRKEELRTPLHLSPSA